MSRTMRRRRHTIVLRVCVRCRESFGISLWPWNGQPTTHTHGLCRECFERLEASLEAASGEAPAARAAFGATRP